MTPTYLVCYDVSNPKRLVRLHRLLKNHGIPVQYSVFCAHLGASHLDRLIALIRKEIHDRQDDVRFYETPRNCEIDLVGRSSHAARHVLFHTQLAPFLRSNLNTTPSRAPVTSHPSPPTRKSDETAV